MALPASNLLEMSAMLPVNLPELEDIWMLPVTAISTFATVSDRQ